MLTVAWAGAHLGPMGLEGAVRLGLRKELEPIADDDEREERVRQATAAAQENAKALNAAQLFEIDDVINPADTRQLVIDTLAAATGARNQPARRAVRRHLVSVARRRPPDTGGNGRTIRRIRRKVDGRARDGRCVRLASAIDAGQTSVRGRPRG